MAKTLRPVVFLDRDGTLNEEVGYIKDISNLRLVSGAAEAVIKLNSAGVAAVLATNQSGAARGYYTEQHILDLNQRLLTLLEEQGARLDAVYYCPHLPEGTVSELSVACQCRKPEPGMVLQAFSDHQEYDRNRAYVVGDKATDVELAHNAGIKGVLVTTGFGQDVLDGKYQWTVTPDFTGPSIVEAVTWILRDLNLD